MLTSCDRVALIDPKSPLLDRLVDDYTAKFPAFRENPYVRAMSARHRLLLELILRRRFAAVRALMALNKRVRGR